MGAIRGRGSIPERLTGTPINEVRRPPHVKARKHSRYRGTGPSYSFDGGELRHHTSDPVHGVIWRSTTDPDEVLHWIADDVARWLAWSWARRTPSAHVMDPFKCGGCWQFRCDRR